MAPGTDRAKPLPTGTYDPIPKTDLYDPSGKLHKDIKLDVARAKYWVGVGAQPSDTVWRLLSLVGILEPKMVPGQKPGSKIARYVEAQRAGRLDAQSKGPQTVATAGQEQSQQRNGQPTNATS